MGTLAVNASGTFMLGLLFAMTTERAILPAEIRGYRGRGPAGNDTRSKPSASG